MTAKPLGKNALKRALLNKTIDTLKHWVDIKLTFTGRVEVMIDSTGNDTVDEVSIKFNKPFEMRPGADTVFLALHYKDADTTLEGNHFRFHHANYGLSGRYDLDTWVPVIPVRKDTKLILGHHAMIRLYRVLERMRDFCDNNHKGWTHFDPNGGVFPYDLLLNEEDYNSFKSLFE